VLKRGYAIVNDDSGTMLDHIDKVHPDQEVIVRLQDGRFSADVKSVLALH
jgi:exonuclease VII large subunit